MLARHAAVPGDRHDADALPVHKRPAPVADLAGFVGNVDDGLFDAQVRALGGEPELSDDLEAGRLVLAAGELRQAVARHLAGVWPAPEQIVPRQHPLRPDVEPACARAALALAVRLAQVERIYAVDSRTRAHDHPTGVSTTRVVLFISSMQFSWPNAVTTFAPLAAVAVPLAKPSPSPSARRHLAKINGFIAANGSWTAYNGQARRCLAKRDAQ